VFATLDGAGPIVAQFPRRSSLLKEVEPGCRIQIEVTKARRYRIDEREAGAQEEIHP
jgi:hypothetical protein